MNRILDGSLTYTLKGQNPDDTFMFTKQGPIYKTMKQELRDILRQFDQDMGDNLLGQLSIRPNEKSLVTRNINEFGNPKWSVMAITDTGAVIHSPKDKRKRVI